MRGKIYLIKKGLGKILYDGQESEIIVLPESFDHGDIVEFNLKNGKFVNLIAYSKDFYYGFVIQVFNQNRGILLVTYPEILGNIIYHFPLNHKDKVKFKLKKSFKGIEAIDIEKVSKQEFYKCNIPLVTKLKKETIYSKEGVVTDVVKSIKTGALEGSVKVVKEDRGFGFISSSIGNLFFLIKDYENTYKQTPTQGSKVYFIYERNQRGLKVKKFEKFATKRLPKNKQYIVIDKTYKIALENYEKMYKTIANEGDIVRFFVDNNRVIFTTDESKEIIFIENQGLKGKIKFVKNGFGFIETKIGDVYFLVNQFEKFYSCLPKKGDEVFFSYKKSEKGISVTKFLSSKIVVDKKKFKNFISFNSDDIFFVYKYFDEISEVIKFDKNNLNQSIAVYKSKIPLVNKIEAIETILENGYESKNIKKEKLLEDLRQALKNSNKKEDKIKLLNLEFNLDGFNSEEKPINILNNFDLKEVKQKEEKLYEVRFEKRDTTLREKELTFSDFNFKPYKELEKIKILKEI